LAVSFRSICLGSAADSTFAVFIGTTGGIAKIRGCRRGCRSADEASFGADIGTSVRAACCFGLNRSSAFWRALLIPSRSWRALAGCQSVVGKRFPREKIVNNSRKIRICREVRKTSGTTQLVWGKSANSRLARTKTRDPRLASIFKARGTAPLMAVGGLERLVGVSTARRQRWRAAMTLAHQIPLDCVENASLAETPIENLIWEIPLNSQGAAEQRAPKKPPARPSATAAARSLFTLH
jgi:hypothetical protein